MKTPICDFVSDYIKNDPLRLHMPGHKGKGFLGVEDRDITEIDGADVLYHESGILDESQKNATYLFDSGLTLYSTEGSTLCIRAMLTLVSMYAKAKGKKPIVAAGRNAHKSFLTGCALLDIDPVWIGKSSLLSSDISAEYLKDFFDSVDEIPTAVYITSPDYLGNISDIASLSEVCHKYGSLLLVDNAHGAYLRFLSESKHPLSLGADLVCDSAHKTLPVLTGGAYLHISRDTDSFFCDNAKQSLALFASTSPSYLILQSLDACNKYLDEGYKDILNSFAVKVEKLKNDIKSMGFMLIGDEPLKITVFSKPFGYLGTELADILQKKTIFCEFSDPDYLVMMLTPELTDENLDKIREAFSEIEKKEPIECTALECECGEKVLTPHDALLSPSETLPIGECVGRILAKPSVSCPPAIPIAICGEKLTNEHIKAFKYYGIEFISVIK